MNMMTTITDIIYTRHDRIYTDWKLQQICLWTSTNNNNLNLNRSPIRAKFTFIQLPTVSHNTLNFSIIFNYYHTRGPVLFSSQVGGHQCTPKHRCPPPTPPAQLVLGTWVKFKFISGGTPVRPKAQALALCCPLFIYSHWEIIQLFIRHIGLSIKSE